MIIFLYGADTFRSRRFLQELKNKFTRDVDPDSQSLSVVDGQTADLKSISEQINTGSLFVKKRFIIIENLFKNKKEKIFNELNDYLKTFTSTSDNVIIFRDEELNTKEKPVKAAAKKLFTFLSGQPYSQEFLPLTTTQLQSFIKKEAQNFDKEISAPAAPLLIDLSNSDVWVIAQEIRKLSFYATSKIITPDDVKTMSIDSAEENVFGLMDALSVKNKKLAIKLLEEQYASGLSDEYLLAMLQRQFKILLQIKEALAINTNPGEIASKLKLHPFVIKKSIPQTQNFSSLELKKYLNFLINLDYLNKTGRGDVKTNLFLLISGL